MFYLPKYVEQLRVDTRRLRVYTATLKRAHTIQKDTNENLKKENEKLRKENNRLKHENEKLQEEIERITKTNNRYQVSLFDHGNFKHPEEREKKKRGGQIGHADTNREGIENSQAYDHKRIFLTRCSHCGTTVNRVNGVEQKVLLDIVLNPQVVKLMVESERQWCGKCSKEVSARDKRCLSFTEYGINTLMMALLLRYRCLLPLSKISVVFAIGYGLNISEAGLLSLFTQAKRYLMGRYEELKEIIRKGQIMYNDETGWQVKGIGAWMWIMANEEATVYIAAESRGKGIAKEIYGRSQAGSMHDGFASYTNAIPKDKQLYCWSHVLRFCYEETVGKGEDCESVHIRDTLVGIYRLKKDPLYHDFPQKLRKEATRQMKGLLKRKTKDPTCVKLLTRLRDQWEGLIRALVVTPNGTNNFAEQELRPIALARKISFGSDTFGGMETTAVLASIVQTVFRMNRETFFKTLQASLRTGFANS